MMSGVLVCIFENPSHIILANHDLALWEIHRLQELLRRVVNIRLPDFECYTEGKGRE